jgi:hypothetical protein
MSITVGSDGVIRVDAYSASFGKALKYFLMQHLQLSSLLWLDASTGTMPLSLEVLVPGYLGKRGTDMRKPEATSSIYRQFLMVFCFCRGAASEASG